MVSDSVSDILEPVLGTACIPAALLRLLEVHGTADYKPFGGDPTVRRWSRSGADVWISTIEAVGLNCDRPPFGVQ